VNKVIKSQDNQQLHFMNIDYPCYFNVAPIIANGDKEENKITLYSVGVNNISFGIYTKKIKAEDTLTQLEKFLLNKSARFQLPPDNQGN